MYKEFVFFGLTFFCLNLNAQVDLDFYKVNELEINDLNTLTSTPDVDFGYNFNEDLSKNIELGYYIWIEDSWYKVVNSNEIFVAESKSPLYFTLKHYDKNDLKIKDPSGVVFSYPIVAIESYIIPNLIYKTNLDVIDNVAKTKNEAPVVLDAQEDSALIVSGLSETLSQVINDLSDSSTDLVQKQDELVLADNIISEEPNDLPLISETIQDLNTQDLSVNSEQIVFFEEAEDGRILMSITENDVVSHDAIDKDTSNEILASPNNDLLVDEKSLNNEIKNENPKNAYEKALSEGFDGTVTEWIESINNLGGESAFQQALNSGFKGTEEEWLRSLWGSDISPEVEKQDKISGIVSQWISELNSSPGNSPYELAIKNGFYGTYTEWVESVIGKDGEDEFIQAVEVGFVGTYKEWIESKLIASNSEILRKEKLKKNNFVIVPNLELQLAVDLNEVLKFDLFEYYQMYFGNSVMSSSSSPLNQVELLPTDLEYQITWFKRDQIEILEISNLGVITYKNLKESQSNKTFINVRFLIP